MWEAHVNLLERDIDNTEKIQKIVHQIWIGKQIPEFKKKFMKTIKDIVEADGF